MYHHFNISKISGKFRMISAPDDRLKMIQKKIAISLAKLYRHRHPVHGFIQDRSVRTNAETHLRRRYILNIDLKDFFPSISEQRVIGLLQSLGVDADVSANIARICCNEGCLPQGAPSSPIISNMICFRLDKSLMDFAKNHRMLYTRYADDISLSSFQPPSAVFEGAWPSVGKLEPEKISNELRKLILRNGFEMNPNKIHYADKNARRVVTGIKVNEGLNVDRSFVRNIRAALYKVEDIGVARAQAELASRFGRNCSIQAHLRGKISWVGFVKGQPDPVFRGLAIKYNACFPSNIIKIYPTPNEIRDRAVWVLEHEEKQGTAFFLKGVGLVTAAHCVAGATKIELFHHSKPSNRFKVGIAHLCTHRDLALLDHSLPSTEFFELDEFVGSPTVGARTVAAGYPSYGFGDKLNIRAGTISSFAVKHAIHLIEVTQKLSQGMSGGPVLTDENSVLGVIHKGGPSEQRDFAVTLAELKTWVSGLP